MAAPESKEGSGTSVLVHHKLDTKLTADCVEWCPAPTHPHLFCVGMYELDKSGEEDTRKGQVDLMQLVKKEDGAVGAVRLESRTLAGVFDMKWAQRPLEDGTTPLAVATAEGEVHLWGLETRDGKVGFKETAKASMVEPTGKSGMALSVDWNNRVVKQEVPKIVCSLSNGHVSVGQLGEAGLDVELQWSAHKFARMDIEVWIAAFDYWHNSSVWTGGDDQKLKSWDLRSGCSRPESVPNLGFEGGVCSLQSHPFREHVLAVGSYDGYLRILDVRKPTEAVATLNTFGGVWRIKWNPVPERSDLLLTASMRGGCHIVKHDGETLKSLAWYTGHEAESLAYGIDWAYGDAYAPSKRPLIGSCSFYNRAFHMWSPAEDLDL